MPERLQVTREPPFAAANVQCSPPWRRQETKELIAMKAPIAVMAYCARPFDPFSGMGFPAFTKLRSMMSILRGWQA